MSNASIMEKTLRNDSRKARSKNEECEVKLKMNRCANMIIAQNRIIYGAKHGL